MLKKSIITILMLTMILSVAIIPPEIAAAKSKPWYSKYWEYKKTAKKSVKIKGSKLYLRGKWENLSSRYGYAKAKKIKKTFKLTRKTKYYLEYEDDTVKKVSKKTFKKKMYSDVTCCTFKVKSKKVVKAILSFN